MKKIKFLVPVALFIAFFAVACGNSGTDTTTTSDTAINKDTINRNPEHFSSPH